MNVTMENKNAQSVKKLHTGECFLYMDNLFIATNEHPCEGLCIRRCVKLKTGTVFYFGQEFVTPVDAEVIIHD